jgi:hypothetical protein
LALNGHNPPFKIKVSKISMYIKQTLQFIDESDLELSWPQLRQVRINSEGFRNESLAFTCRLSENKLKGNLVLAQAIVFTLLDALIDIQHPLLEGKSFKGRYEKLPGDTDLEVAFREIYRIFKLLRNAILHNRSSVIIEEDGVNLRYKHKDGSFELKCTQKAIAILNTFVVFCAKTMGALDRYLELFLISCYFDLLLEISKYSDEFNTPLAQITPALKFRRTVRYRVNNTKLITTADPEIYKLEILAVNKLESWAYAEYLIRKGKERFLVPGEAVDENGFLTKKELLSWKVCDNNFLAY